MRQDTMLPCDRVITQLWEFLDADLNGMDADRVQRHLDVCARCFPEYDFRRAYLRFMRRCSSQRVPPELRRRVFETILTEELTPRGQSADPGVLERARASLGRLLGRG